MANYADLKAWLAEPHLKDEIIGVYNAADLPTLPSKTTKATYTARLQEYAARNVAEATLPASVAKAIGKSRNPGNGGSGRSTHVPNGNGNGARRRTRVDEHYEERHYGNGMNPLAWLLGAAAVLAAILIGAGVIILALDDDNGGGASANAEANADADANANGIAVSDHDTDTDSVNGGGSTYSGPTMYILNGLKCANMGVNLENYPGPTTAEVKSATATDYQRVGTECSAFTFRDPSGKTHDTICPADFVCTYTLADGSVKVYVGDGSHYQASAATVRWHPGYPDGDPVKDNPPCGLVTKEDIFGQGDTPSFRATAGNFSCGGTTSSNTTVPSSSSQTVTGTVTTSGGQTITGSGQVQVAPPNAAPAATQPQTPACDPSVLGGSWTHKGGNMYSLNGSATITGHSAWVVHTPNYPGGSGLPAGTPETVDVATGYCPP